MELNEEQRAAKREYDRVAKQRSRAKEKQERERLAIPNAWDYKMPEPQRTKLDQYSRDFAKAVQADLAQVELSEQDEYVVDAVASVMCGLENNFSQVVHDPEGILVGSHFPDAVASEAVEHVHRFPLLLSSTTFVDLYNKFLKAVLDWSKKNELYSTREFIMNVKAELAREYALPPLPELPKAEPQIPVALPFPTNAEILERGRIELLNRIHPEGQPPRPVVRDPNIAPAARRYLDGL